MSEYITEGDWTVCTCGTRQTGIKVVSHKLTMRGSTKKIATDADKMENSFICLKISSCASLFGTISGASAGCALSGLGGIAGTIGGAAYGAAKGGELGSKLGGKAGKATGGWIGKTIGVGAGSVAGFFTGIGGAIEGAAKGFTEGEGFFGTIGSTIEGAAKGGAESYVNTVRTASDIGGKGGEAMGEVVGSVVGGTTGGIAGGTTGGILGGVAGTVAMPIVGGLGGSFAGGMTANSMMATHRPTGILLIDIMPHICMMLTASKWINCHSNVIISKHHALLLESKLACLMGGLITIIKPNFAFAADMAKLSFFAYNRTTMPKLEKYYDMDEAMEGLDESLKEQLKNEKLDGYVKVTGEDLKELGLEHSDLENRASGFKADIYRYNENGQEKYVLSFRGTYSDPRDKGPADEKGSRDIIDDWSIDWVDDNIKQGIGLGSEQYEQAIAVSKKLKKNENVGGENLTITGHSLGGGLATAAGAATSCETYAFNPAGVHNETYKKYGVTDPNVSNVHTYYSNTDFLNNGNNSSIFLPNSGGDRICMDIGTPFGFATGHDLPLLIKAIEEQNNSQGDKLITTTK